MSWQTLKETKDTYELLGVFAERKVVNAYRDALARAGFAAVAFEPSSLSLSWTITDALGARADSILVMGVLNDGLHMFVIRGGGVYFDYFRSWRAIQGNDTHIEREAFYRLLMEEVQNVVHFVSGRFQEKLGQVLLNTPGMEDDIVRLLTDEFKVRVSPLVSRFNRVFPSWLTVLGAALRGSWDRSRDVFSSLGTERVQVAFREEQTLEFIRLWRNIAATAFGIFILLFGGGLVLLRTEPGDVERRLTTLNTAGQMKELSQFEEQANQFNSIVAAVGTIQKSGVPSVQIVDALEGVSGPYHVILDEITMGGGTSAVEAVMRAPSYDALSQFKKALSDNSDFSSVDIPLSTIAPTTEQFIRFTVNFVYSPQASGG